MLQETLETLEMQEQKVLQEQEILENLEVAEAVEVAAVVFTKKADLMVVVLVNLEVVLLVVEAVADKAVQEEIVDM